MKSLLQYSIATIITITAAFGQCTTCTSTLSLPTDYVIAPQSLTSDGSSFATVTLTSVAGLADGDYLAWCADDPLADIASTFFGKVYSTTDNAALMDMQNANWPRVNYVLNNKLGTAKDVQRVIWLLLGKTPTYPDSAAAQAMYNAAMANGATFVPGPGQITAVLLYQDGATPGGYQDTIIEVTNPLCGLIGDYVWLDSNQNGIQDSTETGINGITVRLLNSAGQQIAQTTTATVAGKAGSYSFPNLCTGTYTVVVDTPFGYTATTSGAGSNRGTDSNGSPAQVSINTSSAATATNLTIDFGFYSTVADACNAQVGDFVWYDANGNGIQDTGEFGLPNVTVRLSIGNVVLTTTTDVNGKYLFTGLCNGSYSISIVNPSTPQGTRTGLQNTTVMAGTDRSKDSNPLPSLFTLTSGASDLTQDFGFKSAGGCTLTQGYWKNHQSVWPITSLVMGGKTYSASELLTILNTPVRGDDSIILAYQLIAAKFNLYSGSAMPTSVPAWITQADAVLAQYAGKIPLKISSASMVSLGGNLDNYNNGRIAGASHCN